VRCTRDSSRDTGLVDAEEAWICRFVVPSGPVEVMHSRPWARVARVPVAGGCVWFKACGVVQAFEPWLTSVLFARWSDRVAEVIASDAEKAWLLLADAGSSLASAVHLLEAWVEALPLYAELQRGETAHADEHLAHGVPDLRVGALPARFDDLLSGDLPLDQDQVKRLRTFRPWFTDLCAELDAHRVPPSIQHGDLQPANLYGRRVLDWGQASIANPFSSLEVTLRVLAATNRLPPHDPSLGRLRSAYLEPWGRDAAAAFDLAVRVGRFAAVLAWVQQRDHLTAEGRAWYDRWFAVVLRRALAAADART
jgi:hypothetical protein